MLVAAMALAYGTGRRFWLRYTVPVVLVIGIAIAQTGGRVAFTQVEWRWARLVWGTPSFDRTSIVGPVVLLFFVTIASQNLPGGAVQRATSVDVPVSPMITTTGLTTLLLVPFAAFGVNFAAITAAICIRPEAHPDPRRRYVVAVFAGLFYLAVGLGAGRSSTCWPRSRTRSSSPSLVWRCSRQSLVRSRPRSRSSRIAMRRSSRSS